MKYARLSTTSKIYLLTLLLIFGILFLNHSVFAQSPSTNLSVSQERLGLMEMYMSWIDDNIYGEHKNDPGNKALGEFKSYLSRVVPEDRACLNETEKQKLSDCREKIKFDYKLARKYNRYLKYQQIEEGKPNVCVKADLGVGTALKAHGFNPAKVDSDNPKETGRTGNLPVYLCTGNDGKKKVRVVDDSGTRLRLSPEDALRSELKVENLPPKGSLDKLLEKLGLK